MGSLCCNANTHIGYYNVDNKNALLKNDAIGVIGTYCDKCGKLCDYVVDGQEFFTDGTPKYIVKTVKPAETNVINKTMKFELSPKEVQSYEKFIEKLSEKYKNTPIEIIFVNTRNGIGSSVIVRVGNKSKNITDYDTW